MLDVSSSFVHSPVLDSQCGQTSMSAGMSLSLSLVILLVSSSVQIPWWILIPDLITLLLAVENNTRMPAAYKKTLQWDKEPLCSRWTEASIKDGWIPKCFWFNLPHVIQFLHFHCRKGFLFLQVASVSCYCGQSQGCFMKSRLPFCNINSRQDVLLLCSLQKNIHIIHDLNNCSDINNVYYKTI